MKVYFTTNLPRVEMLLSIHTLHIENYSYGTGRELFVLDKEQHDTHMLKSFSTYSTSNAKFAL